MDITEQNLIDGGFTLLGLGDILLGHDFAVSESGGLATKVNTSWVHGAVADYPGLKFYRGDEKGEKEKEMISLLTLTPFIKHGETIQRIVVEGGDVVLHDVHKALDDGGWHVTRTGPKIGPDMKIVRGTFKIVAERTVDGS